MERVGRILITGASGFIGSSLARTMSVNHRVICMSRKQAELERGFICIQGDFSSVKDLKKLDGYDIDAVVHLAAVTGGCSEHDGILVNVEGTRTLMNYLMSRGCKKFVLASSIAVIGMQSLTFRPLQVPVLDEHPCLSQHGYGLSKYLMEEVSKYCHRQMPEIDVINLRLSSVREGHSLSTPQDPGELKGWDIGRITVMSESDAVRAFKMAAESPHKPGVRIMNAASARAWTSIPVSDLLRRWWGREVDLSHYEQEGHEFDSLYSVSRIKDEINFTA